MAQSSAPAGPNSTAWASRSRHDGSSCTRATTNTTSASPARPKTRSTVSNLTRHSTTRTTNAATGPHSRWCTLVTISA
ncbi:hypothetical protein KCV87_03335 [Actinosynnema pretiosum subsp. pretiosum]|uniref:Uncharacterized protein n=1 Tax=Actinosynnema pretiosum subsp. pretiosum TaxID=103721 RepID=A0AA45R505_9PSEU|nr:hypothetical protein KCV87_03335 [Actinosynnema pretiosum subsp. pretiosum]